VLKNFTHVKVEITANGRTMISAPLQELRPTTDTVSVYFSGDSTYLAEGVLTIVVKDGELTLTGYQFKVKDFSEPVASR
jgi:hypothetical protein